MKRDVYVRFTVESNSQDHAKARVLKALSILESMIDDTMLLDGKEKEIKEILTTFKLSDYVKF